jgi:hypothetical protein
MIIQIDHIALATPDFKKTSKTLFNLGYRNKFDERNIDNPKIKKALMKWFPKNHDLSLFVKKGDIGIELINHFGSGESGYISPIFENLTSKEEVDLLHSTKTMETVVPVYVKKDSKVLGFNFNKFITKTDDIDKSVSFWANFGFKRKGLYKGSVVLEFTSLYDSSVYDIFLQKQVCNEKHFLDDLGFNCIAFVSSSCEKELSFFKNKGIMITEIERFNLGKKELNIFFVKGPAGELVEIIDFVNKK